MSARHRVLAGVLLVALAAAPARLVAQEFTPADATPLAGSALELVERALPPVHAGVSFEALSLARAGLPELGTRALALRAGWRGWHAAAGIASTGEPEIGWNTAALAIGIGGARAGGAVRAAGRRDRHPEPRAGALGPGLGAEAGAGVWAEAMPAVRVWASAPALWSHGEAPPLARPLVVGAIAVVGPLDAWLEHAGRAGEHRAGVVFAAGTAAVWLEARDRPLRGAAGVRVVAGPFGVAAGIESHPVLGEVARVSLAIGRGP